MASPQRVSIGFQAAPPIALRVSEEELTRLQAALGSEGWHTVAADDGEVRINLAVLAWLKVDKDEQRVGFGLGA